MTDRDRADGRQRQHVDLEAGVAGARAAGAGEVGAEVIMYIVYVC